MSTAWTGRPATTPGRRVFPSLVFGFLILGLTIGGVGVMGAPAIVEPPPDTIGFRPIPLNELGNGRAPRTDGPWKPIGAISPGDVGPGQAILIRIPLPPDSGPDAAVWLDAFGARLEVYQAGGCKLRFFPAGRNGIGGSAAGWRLTRVISLTPTNPGGVERESAVYLRSALPVYLFGVRTGSLDELTRFDADQRRSALWRLAWSIGLSAVLAFLGLASLAAAFYRRKIRHSPFFSFGLFCLLAALDHLADDAIVAEFLFPGPTIQILALMALPLAFIPFFRKVFPVPGERALQWLHRLFSGLFLLVALTSIWLNLPWVVVLLVFSFLVLFALVIMLAQLARRKPRPAVSRAASAALAVLGICAGMDILNILLVLLFQKDLIGNTSLYGIGTLGLVAVFGYALLAHERDRARRLQVLADEAEEHRRRILQLEQADLQARFQALKAQVEPHFLFNTLGTLLSLIETDAPQAAAYTEELVRTYRYVLQTQDVRLVTLEEEWRFARSYFHLIEKRFSGRVRLDADAIPEPLGNWLLPPLSLQVLLENAVKHNAATTAVPLAIRVRFAPEGTVTVDNDRRPRQPESPTPGIGLANLQERCRCVNPRPVVVREEAGVFAVTVPLLASGCSTPACSGAEPSESVSSSPDRDR